MAHFIAMLLAAVMLQWNMAVFVRQRFLPRSKEVLLPVRFLHYLVRAPFWFFYLGGWQHVLVKVTFLILALLLCGWEATLAARFIVAFLGWASEYAAMKSTMAYNLYGPGHELARWFRSLKPEDQERMQKRFEALRESAVPAHIAVERDIVHHLRRQAGEA